MSHRKKPAPVPAAPAFPLIPLVVETFRDPSYDVNRARCDSPSAFNGDVQIRRYRVTAELIDEPIEVLRDRLRTLWLTTESNHHRWGPMRAMAEKLGMDSDELRYEDQGSQFSKAVRS